VLSGLAWVEPVFRDFFRENGTFFAERNAAKKWRFVVGEKWRKMALFFAERNAAKNGALLLAKNGEKWRFFSRSEMRRKWRFVVGENGGKWRFPKEI
jgi:hypothetical protein